MVETVQTTTLSKGDIYVPDKRLDSLVIASYLCLFITLAFVVSNKQILHWFVIPVTLCGILVGADAVDWLRSRVDVFDPVGILGLVGFHFFYLTPLLHVAWNRWMSYAVLLPEDWRPWLGGMAILNLLGLLVYRVTRASIIIPARPQAARTVWRVNKKRFFIVLGGALLLTAAAQMLVLARFGGVSGYIDTFETQRESFTGWGRVFMVSESFPILALIGYAVYARDRGKQVPWPAIALVLALFSISQVLFGGLRGSRSNTIWAVFWAVGIIHYWLRPVSKKAIYGGAVFILIFMYVYGFYKAAGSVGISTLVDEGAREVEAETGRSFRTVLLGDLGRSDVQAYLLYRLTKRYTGYTHAMGRTYLGAAALLIPKAIWPERPPSKIQEGTLLLRGYNSFDPDRRSNHVYGLAGETMLNFGPYVVPFAYIVLGLVVGKVRNWLLTWDTGDMRLLLAPLLVNLCIVILALDSDNVLWFLIKNGSLPGLVTFIGSRKGGKTRNE